jgi:hypothetical protein
VVLAAPVVQVAIVVLAAVAVAADAVPVAPAARPRVAAATAKNLSKQLTRLL